MKIHDIISEGLPHRPERYEPIINKLAIQDNWDFYKPFLSPKQQAAVHMYINQVPMDHIARTMGFNDEWRVKTIVEKGLDNLNTLYDYMQNPTTTNPWAQHVMDQLHIRQAFRAFKKSGQVAPWDLGNSPKKLPPSQVQAAYNRRYY